MRTGLGEQGQPSTGASYTRSCGCFRFDTRDSELSKCFFHFFLRIFR
jgi:hypothetical protein